MSRESADVTLQLIADHLNISVTSLDVNRTYEELGGDSVTLLRLINSLKSKSIPIPIPVFNSPNTIQDVITYAQRENNPTSHEHDLDLDHQQQQRQHRHPNVYRIEPYADVADKEHLISMCCRSFLTNNLLASLAGVSSEEFTAYVRNYHDADTRRPLSIAVYDTTRGEYVGGSFLCSFTQDHPQGPTSKALLALQHVVENLEDPYKRLIGEDSASSLLYTALMYAEPSLSPSEHLAIFHRAHSEVIDIARRSGFRGVVATQAHYVTQVHYYWISAPYVTPVN
jgi:acyl carrier protein